MNNDPETRIDSPRIVHELLPKITRCFDNKNPLLISIPFSLDCAIRFDDRALDSWWKKKNSNPSPSPSFEWTRAFISRTTSGSLAPALKRGANGEPIWLAASCLARLSDINLRNWKRRGSQLAENSSMDVTMPKRGGARVTDVRVQREFIHFFETDSKNASRCVDIRRIYFRIGRFYDARVAIRWKKDKSKTTYSFSRKIGYSSRFLDFFFFRSISANILQFIGYLFYQRKIAGVEYFSNIIHAHFRHWGRSHRRFPLARGFEMERSVSRKAGEKSSTSGEIDGRGWIRGKIEEKIARIWKGWGI